MSYLVYDLCVLLLDENMVDKSDRLFEEPESVVEPLPTPAADTNVHPSEPDAGVIL